MIGAPPCHCQGCRAFGRLAEADRKLAEAQDVILCLTQVEKYTAMKDRAEKAERENAQLREENAELRAADDLQLGDAVEVDPSCRHYGDWRGVRLFVAGIQATARTGEPTFATSDEWPPVHGLTDGWLRSDLRRTALAQPSQPGEPT